MARGVRLITGSIQLVVVLIVSMTMDDFLRDYYGLRPGAGSLHSILFLVLWISVGAFIDRIYGYFGKKTSRS